MSKMRVKFTIGDVEVFAQLNGGPTAGKVAAALPLEGGGNYWGQEFYFSAPVRAVYEPGASDVVDPGTVAFWVEGSCVCLFWGPTPVSRGQECRAASKVNVIGRVESLETLRGLRGRSFRLERA